MSSARIQSGRSSRLLFVLLTTLLLGLPLAVWLDLRSLTEDTLVSENASLGEIIDSVRHFYADEIIGRIEADGSAVQFTHEFREVDQAIPIPSTFSKELAKLIQSNNRDISYRFVSDYPFVESKDTSLDEFELRALTAFRDTEIAEYKFVGGTFFNREVRLATPVKMTESCVSCHNAHPQSPKRDWKVGDVRGIQAITAKRKIASNMFAFKFLIAYFLFAGSTSIFIFANQQSQSRKIENYNEQLANSNETLNETQIELKDTLSLLEEDLENARQFQELALPQVFPFPEKYDFASYFIPARHVGGDFFDVFELPGEQVGFVMADVSDKGVKAAFFAAITRSVLLDIATTEQDPADALALVNKRLLNQNPSDLFVTMLYGIINFKNGTLKFASCAHQSPLIRRAGGSSEVLKVSPCVPVGLFPDISPGKCEIQFSPGDAFVVYTDGVTDAGTHTGSAFGENRILELLSSPELESAEQMAACIKSHQQAHAPDDLFDDSAVLIIKML